MQDLTVSQFIGPAILAGMFAGVALAWFVFDRAPLTLDLARSKRIIASLAVGAVLLAWLLLAVTLARQGFFEAVPSSSPQLPNIALTGLPLVIGFALLAFSKSFRRLVDALPLPWLMGIQSYRVLGVLFLILYAQGSLPPEFAIPAGVGDILVGIAALSLDHTISFDGDTHGGWRSLGT